MNGNMLGELELLVEFGPSLSAFTDENGPVRSVFATELLRLLSDLRNDLMIPAKVSVSVRLNEHDTLVGNPFQVFINGTKCRLPVEVPNEKSATDLARFIADGIQHNLALFIGPALSRKIRERWSSENAAPIPRGWSDQRFHEVLSMLVSRGFGIDRINKARDLDEEVPVRLKGNSAFEQVVAGLDTTTVKVFLKKGAAKILSGNISFEEKFDRMQERIFNDLGLLVPQTILMEDDRLQENEFRLQLNDVRASPGVFLDEDQYLVDASRDKLKLLEIKSEDAINPETGTRCALIRGSQDKVEKCKEAGYVVWDRADFIVLALAGAIWKDAGNLLTAEIVRHCLKLLEGSYPELVNAALDRFNLGELTQTLRILLDEETSIRDMRTILESLLAVRGTTGVDHNRYFVFHADYPDLCPVICKTFDDLDPDDYSSCVRMALKRRISYSCARPGETLIVYVMSSTIEQAIANCEQRPLSESDHSNLIRAIFDRIGKRPPGGPPPVILTTVGIRRKLKNLIDKEFPRLTILCNQELLADVMVQRIGQICSDELKIDVVPE